MIKSSEILVQITNNETVKNINKYLTKLFNWEEEVTLLTWHHKFFDPIFCALQSDYSKIVNVSQEIVDVVLNVTNYIYFAYLTQNDYFLSKFCSYQMLNDLKTKIVIFKIIF